MPEIPHSVPLVQEAKALRRSFGLCPVVLHGGALLFDVQSSAQPLPYRVRAARPSRQRRFRFVFEDNCSLFSALSARSLSLLIAGGLVAGAAISCLNFW